MRNEIFFHAPRRSLGGRLDYRLIPFSDRLRQALVEINMPHQFIDRDDFSLRNAAGKNHITFHTNKSDPKYINWKDGYLDDYHYFDPSGFSGYSAIVDQRFSPDQVDRKMAELFFDDLSEKYVANGRTRWDPLGMASKASKVPKIPAGSIVVFLQVHNDVTMKLAYTSNEQMIAATLRNRNGRAVFIKRHPSCSSVEIATMLEKYACDRSDIYVTRGHVHHLVEQAGMVVCMNSGAGFEALLQCVPVVTFAKSDYHHVSFTVRNIEMADTVFAKVQTKEMRIKKYLYWYLNQKMVSPLDENFTEKIADTMAKQGWL